MGASQQQARGLLSPSRTLGLLPAPATHCPLPSAHCWLLLPTAHCPLSAAHSGEAPGSGLLGVPKGHRPAACLSASESCLSFSNLDLRHTGRDVGRRELAFLL